MKSYVICYYFDKDFYIQRTVEVDEGFEIEMSDILTDYTRNNDIQEFNEGEESYSVNMKNVKYTKIYQLHDNSSTFDSLNSISF